MAAAIRYMPIAESEKQELSSILMQDVPSPEEFKAMQDKLAMYESQTAEATTQNINALTAETIQKAKKVAADTALSKAKTIETISKIGVVNA